MKDLYIIGAGGLGREVAWQINRINKVSPTWRIVGFVDDNPQLCGASINGITVLGGLSYLNDKKDAYVVCAIGFAVVRKKAIEKLSAYQLHYATLIDPSAIVSDDAIIGEGSIISMNTVVSTNTIIEDHVLVNYGSTIGHDVTLKNFTTIYPGSNISGNVLIGSCTEIGTGSQIIQGLNINNDIIIGAGSVVIKDIQNPGTYAGVPVRKVR